MEPVLRISGNGLLRLTLEGLSTAQAEAIRRISCSSNAGAGRSAPRSFLEFSAPDDRSSAAALTGSPAHLQSFLRSFLTPDVLPEEASKKIVSLLDNFLRTDYKIDCRGKVLDLASRTHVMGVLNVTPDSFSDGGLFADPERAIEHGLEMAAAGADIIDIGGESTRPGALPLSEEEELRRIIPLIERLAPELAVPLSVDTYKSSVAEKALRAGASIVNDISGLRFSPDMAAIVADYGAALIIMHIKGTPRNMQQNPEYADVMGEIRSSLEEGLEIAGKAGVDREKVLIDPGIGFGKTLEHNLTILNDLEELKVLGRPIVLGTSRKKFIGTILHVPDPKDRVAGTAATVALGIERGAKIVRVHDVAQMVHVARMTDAVVKGKL